MTQPLDLAAIRAQGKIPHNDALLPIIRLSDLPDQPPERLWTWDGYIPHGQVTLLTGAGSAGKSLKSQQLCSAIAAGQPFMGLDTRKSNAMYVTCEDDTDELHRRQVAINRAMGLNMRALDGKLNLISLVGEHALIDNSLSDFGQDGKIRQSALYKRLLDAALTTDSRFIVLDNTAHFFAGDENNRHEVASFIGLLNQLAQAINGAVLLIGHPNKSGAGYSGSTAWENQVRSRLFMEVHKAPDGTIPDPDMRVITRAKSNYAKTGDELLFKWHEWAFVLPDEAPVDLYKKQEELIQSNKDDEAFLKCLEIRNKQKRAVSNRPSRSFAPSEFCKMPEGKRIGKKRLTEAMERLFRTDRIERCQLWINEHRKPVIGLRLTRGQRAANAANENRDCEESAEKTPEICEKTGAANDAVNDAANARSTRLTQNKSVDNQVFSSAANAANEHYISKDIYPGANSPPDDISELGFQSWLNGEDYADGDQATDPPRGRDD